MLENANNDEKKKGSGIKKFLGKAFRSCIYVVLSTIGLNALLFIILSIPPVQQALVNFAVDQLQSVIKTEASIGEIKLSLFNNISIKELYVEDQAKDTLVYAKHLEVSLSPWELVRSKKLAITQVSLDDFLININKKDSISDYNFQFLVDSFSSNDTTKTDTTSMALLININDINIRHGRLNYDVLSDSITPNEFNASHISLYDFNANADISSIDMNSLDIALNSLTVKDKSGVEITSISGHVYSNMSELWVDNLALTLPNSHLRTSRAMFDLESQKFELGTQDAEIDGRDLVAFLPSLKYLTHKLTLQLDAAGKLPMVELKELAITYGDDAILEGRASIESYERYANSDLMVAIDRFKMTPKALSDFVRLGDSTFVAPAIIDTVGNIYLKGKVDGKISNFDLDIEAWTKQGAVDLLAQGSIDSTFDNMKVKASLQTVDFNLNEIIMTDPQLGKFTTHITINASQTQKGGLNAEVRGVLNELQINEESLKDLYFVGNYDDVQMGAKIYRESKTGTVFASASMTHAKEPEINIKLNLYEFKIGRIFPNEDWIDPRLTIRFDGYVKDLDIDNMIGKLSIDSLIFEGDNFRFEPGPIRLDISKHNDGQKDITLTSSILSANIHGNYFFKSLPYEFANVMHKCLPSVFEKNKNFQHNHNDFTFSITANSTQNYGKIFALPIDITKPLFINGFVNTVEEQIEVHGDIPQMRYNDIDINSTKLSLANQDSTFNFKAQTSALTKVNTYNFKLDTHGGTDRMHSKLKMVSDSTGLGINGDIESITRFSRNATNELVTSMQTVPTDVNFGKLNLNLLPAQIEYVGDRITIEDFGINVENKPFFGMEGAISPDPHDVLKIFFTEAQIGDILKGVDINDYKAVLNGEIELTNIMKQPELHIYDFMMQDITIINDTIGTMNIASEWSDEKNAVRFEGLLQKDLGLVAQLTGQLSMKTDSLDVSLKLNEFGLKWIEPFAEGMISQLDGSISSDLSITGTIKHPITQGFLGFNDTKLGIDFTNVVYTISDTIRVTPEKVGFNNLTLKDEKGNTAKVNANITHQDFKNMKFDLDMNLNNLMVLNTMHRTDSLFYGRIFASGKVNIKGDQNKMDINMQVRNEKNSKLNILIPQTSEASKYKSVVYINTPVDTTLVDTDSINVNLATTNQMAIKLSVALDINQNMELGVVIDPVTGDAMDMKGNGNINFTYDMNKNIMNTFGRFMLTDGNVKFNLQNIKKLDFKIKDGSNLSFIGDPFKTSFDIIAYRRVRADLKTLDYSFETNSQSTRVQVDCELGIKGDMNKMDLSYDISLPNASDDDKRKVSSLINTDEQKIRQFAYLIASGSFYSSTGSSGASFTDGMWTNLASSTLSSGLNSALGGILGDKWEVGTNLESSDGSLNSLDMSVNVSTKLLDDRLRLNTSLGYRTDNSTSADNSIIGDFEAEYDLNSTWMVKAYNHTNDKFYRQAPTTQGIGIAYTKDAATLRRLFQTFKPKWRNSKEGRLRRQRRDSIRRIDSLHRVMDSIEDLRLANPLHSDSISVNTDSIKPILIDSVLSIDKMPIRNEEKE